MASNSARLASERRRKERLAAMAAIRRKRAVRCARLALIMPGLYLALWLIWRLGYESGYLAGLAA